MYISLVTIFLRNVQGEGGLLLHYLLDPQLLFSYPLSTNLLRSGLTLLDPQHLGMLASQLLTDLRQLAPASGKNVNAYSQIS